MAPAPTLAARCRFWLGSVYGVGVRAAEERTAGPPVGSQVARRRRRRAYRILVSVGLLGYGLTHLVVAGLALYVAFGLDANASYAGALRAVANRPLGELLMWAMAVGFGTLTGWQVSVALTWRTRGERWTRPVGAFGRACTYAVLALLALGTIIAAEDASAPSSTISAQLLDTGFGRWAVAGVGLGVGAVGIAKIGRGCRRTFVEDLNRRVGRPTLVFGIVGHIAKGLVLVEVGLLLVAAGLTQNAADVGGIDLALANLRDYVFGPALLVALAAGLACFGLYCLVWSTRPRVVR